MGHEAGDKVKLKSHQGITTRGGIEAIQGDELLIRLDKSGEVIAVTTESVTNFSFAARKAWQNMPYRQVGRPKGARHCDRISVTLRIDRTLWDKFRQNELAGSINDRTATINAWFSKMLDKLERAQGRIDGAENHR